MIRLQGVRKVFNAGNGNEFTAVDEVTLAIEKGKVTVLKGPSGSGKTTLLSLMGCMARPTAGRIYLSGLSSRIESLKDVETIDISSLPERFLTEIRRSAFGFIFQQFNLIRGITALENVMLPVYPLGNPPGEMRQKGLDLLDTFGLKGRAESKIDWLSGGELQRVAIARALINSPAVVIADEPTAHLDSRLSHGFMEIVSRFRDEGKTVIIASHDPIVCEAPAVDAVVEMRDGRLTAARGDA